MFSLFTFQMWVVVTREFLLSVERNIEHQRPPWRIDAAKIDFLREHALLITDHSVFSEGTSQIILFNYQFCLLGHYMKLISKIICYYAGVGS